MTARNLFKSELIAISTHCGCGCQLGRHDGGGARKVTLVRRGVYTCWGAGELLVVDGLTAAIYDGRSDYDIQFPTGGLPDSTYVQATAEVMDEAFPTDRYHVLIGPRTALKHQRLYAAANDAQAISAEVEEAAMDLLADLSEGIGRRTVSGPASLRVRRRLDIVRTRLMAEPEVNHQLADLAREAGCSPFHFARLFKRETGCSVRAYRVRLRLAMVLDRLRQGANDLADVALEAGFSHHSHMTAACRSLLGETPSSLRQELSRLRKAA